MRRISPFQLAALWVCLIYLMAVCLSFAGRAAWGFLRLASEHREPLVPRKILLAVANSAARDFSHYAWLLAIGVVALGGVTIWITRLPKV